MRNAITMVFHAAATAAVLAGMSARAETVLWYRFDECGTGQTRATADTVIKNFVSPGALDGYARSYSGSTLSTDSQYMPYGVATLPED